MRLSFKFEVKIERASPPEPEGPMGTESHIDPAEPQKIGFAPRWDGEQ